MAGIKVLKFESLNETTVGIRAGIFPSKGGTVAEIIEPTTAQVIARYSDRKKFYKGSPAVTVNNHGSGKVYYFGTTPGPLGLFILYRKILKDAGLNPGFRGYGIETIHRISPDGTKFRVILNHTPKTRFTGFKKIGPYEMKILG
jgi:beta-galactosidase